jgi:hypothetical protein
MTKLDTSQIQWREPWTVIHPNLEAESELKREMCAGHALFGRSVKAVGWRRGVDNFLFYLGDTPPRFAVVHLTWGQETRPEWPYIEMFDSLDDWMQRRMIPDADEWELMRKLRLKGVISKH